VTHRHRWTHGVILSVVAALTASACSRTPVGYAIDPPAPVMDVVLQGGAPDVYVDPDNPAAQWLQVNPASPLTKTVRERIASRPAAHRTISPTDGVFAEVTKYVTGARQQNRQRVIIADSDQITGCGAEPEPAYQAWFAEFARALGDGKPLVVIDAVHDPKPSCAAAANPDTRVRILEQAVRTIRATTPQALVFLNATDSTTTAQVVSAARDATGLAINVGKYASEQDTDVEGDRLRQSLRATTGRSDQFILVDSSRNDGEVRGDCNPDGAKVGSYISLGDDSGRNQSLWLTTPGVSDGPCGIAPTSQRGQFVPELAAALLK
jgi:endoglucanase